MAANLSVSDVKAIARRANFEALQLPIHKFFPAIEKSVDVLSPSIFVRSSTALASLLLTLSATRIHQLYLVDAALHPVGVVRICDILALLVRDETG